MSGTQDELKRAYNFIKHDQTDEAQAILRPILAQEPENVHAWWLMAHALTDPGEIRDALTKVITLDPNYSNAGKARQLLAQLDEQYPQAAAAPAIFEEAVVDEGVFVAGPVEEEEASAFWEEPFESAFPTQEETPFLVGEQFPDLDEDMFATEGESEAGAVFAAPAQPGAATESDLRAMFEFQPESGTVVDEGVEAAREEKAARRRGRGGRLLRLVVGPLVVLVVAAIVVAALILGGGTKAQADPGRLKVLALAAEPANIQNALDAAKGELAAVNLGTEGQVVVAESSLGQTLFVEFCAQPSPDLPPLIAQGMDIAARQARAVEGTLPAVGVSIDLCSGEKRDNLYRAFVSTADAIRYLNGDLGQGEVGAASFQALWKTS
jgi:hypothetical protein